MKTSDFDYFLPSEAIAQHPVEPRDTSRLLVLDRNTGVIEHTHFYDLGKYLHPGDLIVLNQTRVIPARLFGRKESGGKVEILLLKKEDAQTWECLVGGKGLQKGKKVWIDLTGENSNRQGGNSINEVNHLYAVILETWDGSQRLIRFSEPIEPHYSEIGHVPLPPYIHEKLNDPERYQTVYARELGSAAAPTAGLHFTNNLLEKLQISGIELAYVTLHVGLDTFAPVLEKKPIEHQIHTEWCEISQQTSNAINRTRSAGGRIIAIGTTTVRTLESAAMHQFNLAGSWTIQPFSGPTSLYILPGYEFKVVDMMVTNFHLPKSTLIMLVSAFAGRERILNTYQVALKNNYRFYSFGDAMLIL
jgi:S-adenosylmethionine:tRNA ribosyltransferase-isomerase